MFRAGRAGAADTPDAAAVAVFSGNYVLLADCSEFQPDIAGAAYLAWSKAVIIRAAYGDQHDDRAWYGGQRRDLLHQLGVKFLGIYIYVVAAQDPLAQAEALIHLVGPLRKGEKIILDIEEGTGDLRTTRDVMSHTIAGALGDMPWTYSGLYFAAAHNLAPVDWLADYASAEPAEPHTLWQLTDSFAVPGVGVADCSLYHGTIDQLAARAWQGTQPAPQQPAPAPNWTEALVNELPTLAVGATGEDVRTVQGGLVARHQSVTVDGSFGPATRAAVEALQRSAGITADGVVGPHTWAKLLGR